MTSDDTAQGLQPLQHDYLRYSPAVETPQQDEAELIDQIAASMKRVAAKVFDKHRHAVRPAHAKSHGILVGTLTVYDGLAPHLRQGLFAQAASYPVVIRLSSAPHDILSDRMPSPKGMAIKVIDVPGRKLLPGAEDELTQDFLLVNNPALPSGDIAAFWKVQQVLEKHADDSEMAMRAAALLGRSTSRLLGMAGMGSAALATSTLDSRHILGETFHSMAPLRFGDYIAKLSVAPLSAPVRRLTGVGYDPERAPTIVRDQVVTFFQGQGAEYELRAQLCTDLDNMPVEDASVIWSEQRSPHQPVAKITLPPQQAYSPARRVYGDEVLSFTPWHCIEEHRPLGSIMRARLKAYEAASAYRHAANVQLRVEPRTAGDIPD